MNLIRVQTHCHVDCFKTKVPNMDFSAGNLVSVEPKLMLFCYIPSCSALHRAPVHCFFKRKRNRHVLMLQIAYNDVLSATVGNILFFRGLPLDAAKDKCLTLRSTSVILFKTKPSTIEEAEPCLLRGYEDIR